MKGTRVRVCTSSIGGDEADVLRQSVSPEYLTMILPPDAEVALVFGRESVGLTREELRYCDILSTIETGSEYNVLNLSHAVSLYLYILTRHGVREGVIGAKCGRNTFDAILKFLRGLCEEVKEEDACLALKHLMARASITLAECKTLYRFFKRLYYRVVRSRELNP